jgi:hypothetical protein
MMQFVREHVDQEQRGRLPVLAGRPVFEETAVTVFPARVR